MLDIHEVYDTRNPFLFTEESMLGYQPGGYHPVVLGETLDHGRYKICHKLGHGSYSTVWVARDNKLEKWVSIKITTADQIGQSREISSLRGLAEHPKKNPGAQSIVELLDDFVHDGPNGRHHCLVFKLLGPTLEWEIDLHSSVGERLDPEDILRMSTQLLQAVAFIHDAGYAHGNLSVKNIVSNSGCLSHCSEEKLFDLLGPPETEEVVRLDGEPLGDGVPSKLVQSAQWLGWPDEYDEDDEDVRIIDFGEAFAQNAVPTKIAQNPSLQAPETIFEDTFDHRIDIWSVGLIVPFGYWGLDFLVAEMIRFRGAFPVEWESKWKQLRRDTRGPFRIGDDWEPGESSGPTLEQDFRKNIHEPELQVLLPAIEGLTRLIPSDRISATQALILINENT